MRSMQSDFRRNKENQKNEIIALIAIITGVLIIILNLTFTQIYITNLFNNII